MSKQFTSITSVEQFKSAVEEHLIPLIESCTHYKAALQWKGDTIALIQSVHVLQGGGARQMTHSVYWNKLEEKACYVEGSLPQYPPKQIN